MTTAYERDQEVGRQINHRLTSAAKAYAADPTSEERFNELMAAGEAWGKRTDEEWRRDLLSLGKALEGLRESATTAIARLQKIRAGEMRLTSVVEDELHAAADQAHHALREAGL